MNDYINGGIIVTFSVKVKDVNKMEDVYNYLWDKIDVNLYDEKRVDNLMIFTLKSRYFNLIESFYKELDDNMLLDSKLMDDMTIKSSDKIKYSLLSNSLYDIEFDYYLFFREGPYTLNDSLKNIVDYLFVLTKQASHNLISNGIVFFVSQ